MANELKLGQHQAQLPGVSGGVIDPPVFEPVWEISAYEALWNRFTTVKRLADLFDRHEHALPSVVAAREGIANPEVEAVRDRLRDILPFMEYAALFYRDFEYPNRLRDAQYPIEVLYYQGVLDLLSSRAVSVVGTRQPTEAGIKRTRKLVQLLVKHDLTVMSGLAEGIDTAAHQTAIDAGGRTIAVIGTPLSGSYPKSNEELQRRIARDFLVVTQVPFYLASQRDWRGNRAFFPERNKTMSALSHATIIVEASETSGTLFQAKAAIQQRRKLFILDSCFDAGLKWPEEYLGRGAVRVKDGSEILEALGAAA
ncbi:MAG: DNA-protecting protein DprA [Deltaproteobacteria bacterium]|nr:DNA-protecting protein DprA [Deltaproteobacteria bacterium]